MTVGYLMTFSLACLNDICRTFLHMTLIKAPVKLVIWFGDPEACLSPSGRDERMQRVVVKLVVCFLVSLGNFWDWFIFVCKNCDCCLTVAECGHLDGRPKEARSGNAGQDGDETPSATPRKDPAINDTARVTRTRAMTDRGAMKVDDVPTMEDFNKVRSLVKLQQHQVTAYGYSQVQQSLIASGLGNFVKYSMAGQDSVSHWRFELLCYNKPRLYPSEIQDLLQSYWDSIAFCRKSSKM